MSAKIAENWHVTHKISLLQKLLLAQAIFSPSKVEKKTPLVEIIRPYRNTKYFQVSQADKCYPSSIREEEEII